MKYLVVKNSKQSEDSKQKNISKPNQSTNDAISTVNKIASKRLQAIGAQKNGNTGRSDTAYNTAHHESVSTTSQYDYDPSTFATQGNPHTDSYMDELAESMHEIVVARSCDPMLVDAVDIILQTGQATASNLQRHLKLGYARASRIIDEMEYLGIIGPFRDSSPREIKISIDQWTRIRPSVIDALHQPNDEESSNFEDSFDQIIDTAEELDRFIQEHPLIDDMYTKVVGVSFPNDNGTSRQEILSLCSPGDPVFFSSYRYNGEPALAVFSNYGQIGNLSARLAESFESDYDCDLILAGEIAQITGGENGLKYGCNLHILVYRD